MAKLLYSATMSLDGFVTAPGGDMSWLTEYPGPHPAVEDLARDVGALLVGNGTFRGDAPHRGPGSEGGPFGGGWRGPRFVLTHRPPATSVPGVAFVTDLVTAVSAARTAAGEKYVNVMGASVARQCLAAGMLDEILVCVAPVLLGGGVRLFDRPGGDRVRLERLSLTEAPRTTNLRMRVVR